MDPARGHSHGPRRKFLGRFAIPVGPRKVTREDGLTSRLQSQFKRPAIVGDHEVQKTLRNEKLSDNDCTFGDSFCDEEVLEGLCEIEAQYSSAKHVKSASELLADSRENPTSASKSDCRILKNHSDDGAENGQPIHMENCIRSPRICRSNTENEKPDKHLDCSKSLKCVKIDKKNDKPKFTSIGADTLEAIDALDLDDSDFPEEITSPGDEQNRYPKSLKILHTPLRSRFKKKILSDSNTGGIRRSQRLKVKQDTSSNKIRTDSILDAERSPGETTTLKGRSVSKTWPNKLKEDGSVEIVNKENESSLSGLQRGPLYCGNSKDLILADPLDIQNQDSKLPFKLKSLPQCIKKIPKANQRTEIVTDISEPGPSFLADKLSDKHLVKVSRDDKEDLLNMLGNTKPVVSSTARTESSSSNGNKDVPHQNVEQTVDEYGGKQNSPPSLDKAACPEDSDRKEDSSSKVRSGIKAGKINNCPNVEILNECVEQEVLTFKTCDTVNCSKSLTSKNSVQSCKSRKDIKSSSLTVANIVETGLKTVTQNENQKHTAPKHQTNVEESCTSIEIEESRESKRPESIIIPFKSSNHVESQRNTDIPHDPGGCTVKNVQEKTESSNRSDSPLNQRRKSSLNNSTNTSKDGHSFLSTQAKMEISSWGLPDSVLQRYYKNGIKTMFPWQAECLSLPSVLDGKNLVYSAPTSAGKTLVAELLLLKKVLESGRKGVFILPFVSVAREKMYYLQKMFSGAGVRVEGFMGSQGPPGGLKVTDIAVCTIEKANNLVNRLLEEKRLNELGIIVVDELHMLGDSHRGYLLELLLTKVMFVSGASSSRKQDQWSSRIQIVGMSATLPNLDLLASWLDAQLYSTDYRPIPLTERVKMGKAIYDSEMNKVRELDPLLTVKGDSDHLIQLCLETVLEGFSVLVFCPTKAWCEKLAENVAKEFFSIGKPDSQYSSQVSSELRKSLNSEGISRVMEALRKCPVGLDKVLARSIAFGAAFHHAGLTFDERDIVEGGFRTGSIRVLVATSTLSSGVNLPARRVIIRSPVFGGSILDTLTYKQMIGRAGRKGVDTEGESILICRDGEKHKAKILMTSALPAITSCLQQDASLTSSMKRAILEVIVSGIAATPAEVEGYCNCTLLAASLRDETTGSQSDTQNSILSCVKFLEENEYVRLQESEDGVKYIGTQLGCAVLASGLSPDEGLHVFGELHRARQCFVLENELHIIYQVTPVYVSSAWPNMDWLTFLSIWESLSEDMKRVAELVGVEESFIVRAMKGTVNRKVRRQAKLLAVHQRFYTALALHELVQEVPLNVVAKKFAATRGMLQSLQQSAATFAGMVTVFCNRLGWHNLELLVAQFHDRLHFGIQRELCDLVRLSCVNGQRARYLYNAGLETVSVVAHSTKDDVENILQSATPFHSNKMDENNCRSGGTIWLSSGEPLTEAQAAFLIVEEARQLVQKELGLTSIDWSQKDRVITTPNHRPPRVRTGSSSASRRILRAKRRHSTSPNSILRSEAARGRGNVTSRIVDGVIIGPTMTPLNKSFRKRRSSPCVIARDRKSKSPRSDFEVKELTRKLNEDFNEEVQSVSEEIARSDNTAPALLHDVKNTESVSVGNGVVKCPESVSVNNGVVKYTERENVDNGDVKCTERENVDNGDVKCTESGNVDNENVKCTKPGSVGNWDVNCAELKHSKADQQNLRDKHQMSDNVGTSLSSKQRTSVEVLKSLNQNVKDLDVSKNQENVMPNVNAECEFETHSKKRERKDTKGKPKNRKWRESDEEKANENKEKENMKPPENSEQSREILNKKESTTRIPRSLIEEPRKEVKKAPSLVGILFGRSKSKKKVDVDLEDVGSSSFCIPESQEDKADNMFSPKRKAKVKNDCHDKDFNIKVGHKNENVDKSPNKNAHKIPDIKITETDILESAICQNLATNSCSLKTSTPVNSNAKTMLHVSIPTPITVSDAKYNTELTFQQNECYSFGSSVANLTLSDAHGFDSPSEERNNRDERKEKSRESDLFKESSYEKSSELYIGASKRISATGIKDLRNDTPSGDVNQDSMGLLSESQREAFLRTMDSHDFDDESFGKTSLLQDMDEADEPMNETGFNIGCNKRKSFEDFIYLEPRKKNQQINSLKTVNVNDKFVNNSEQICVKDQRKLHVIEKYHACSEDLDFGFDLSHTEERNRDYNNGGRIQVNNADGSYIEFVEDQNNSVGRDTLNKHGETSRMDIISSQDNESSSLVDLEQNICESQNVNGNGDISQRKDETLSDSFLDRAFETYIHFSPNNKEVVSLNDKLPNESKFEEKELLKVSTAITFKENNDVEKNHNIFKVDNGTHIRGSAHQSEQNESNNKRLSDDLFSSPLSPVPTTHRIQQVMEDETCSKKDNQVVPEHSEVQNMPKPSTSALSSDAQIDTADYSCTVSNSFCIIDVVSDSRVFDCFLKELGKQEIFSLSLACEKPPAQQTKGGIGWRIAGHNRTPRRTQPQKVAGLVIENSNLLIVGIAICWGGQDAYYINLRTSQEEAFSCSLPTPPLCEAVSFEKRLMAVKEVLSGVQAKDATICTWDAKNCVKYLAAAGIECLASRYEDPKIASWMLDPGAKEQNIHNMVMNYKMECLPLLESLGSSWGLSSLGINTDNPGSCRVRSATECVVVFHLIIALKTHLKEVNMLQSFVDVEMPSVVTLAYMELNGMGFSNRECDAQKAVMQVGFQ